MKLIDPNDPSFECNNLTGDEQILCSTCNTTFDLHYLEGLANNEATWPKEVCCRDVLKKMVQFRFKSFADNMVVSHDPILRKAGVDLRNKFLGAEGESSL